MAKNAQAAAEKWARNLQNAGPDMAAGVAGVTVNPAQAAIKAKPKMLANFQSAMAQGGKYDTAMSKVTLQQWQNAMTTLGISRAMQGASQAVPKMANFLTKLIAYQEANLASVRAMPNITDADAKARMNAAFDVMKKFKNT